MIDNKYIIPATIVAIGIGVCGFFPGFYWNKTENEKFHERNTVSVKGLAERIVKSNLATWEIQVWGNYNDWNVGKPAIEKKTNEVITFLKENGLKDSEIIKEKVDRSDRYATENDIKKIIRRYQISQIIKVKTDNVSILNDIKAKIGKLRTNEIDIGLPSIKYFYFDLNKIKPDMLQEALANGKIAAKKFTEESGLNVGKIKTASQGAFEVHSEPGSECGRSYYDDDDECSMNKQVRVVSTIEYYLE